MKAFLRNKFKALVLISLILIGTSGFAQLNGNYIVGSGGDYTSVNDAVDAINAQGINGAVVFNILPGTYSTHCIIDTIIGSSEINTVTFKSSTGEIFGTELQYDAADDTSNYIFKLNGASNLIFRDMEIRPQNQVYRRAFHLISNRNITIEHCKIAAYMGGTSSTNSFDGGLIYSRTFDTGFKDSLITITNNSFYGGRNAISISSSDNYSLQIDSNEFYSQQYSSIYLYHIKNYCKIFDNRVSNSLTGVNSGISVNSAEDDLEIHNNRVEADDCWLGIELGNSMLALGSGPHIYNNLVYLTTTRDYSAGIQVYNGENANVQFNTAIVNGPSQSSAFRYRYGAQGFIVQNNDFVQYGSGYVFSSFDSHDPTTEISIFDYNNMYTAGNYFCKWAGNTESLSDFMTQTSNAFLNNITQNPTSFIFNIYNTAIACNLTPGTGINVPSITNDYNYEARLNPPTVGALKYQNPPVSYIHPTWLQNCGPASDYIETDVTNMASTNWYFDSNLLGADLEDDDYNIPNTGWFRVDVYRDVCIITDSVLITINNPTNGTDVQTACESYTWIDGNTYTSNNNTATYTLTNSVGCDSVVTLDLTITHSTTGIDTQTACDSFTWIDGNTYTLNNNTATYTLTNFVGCDSIVTLDLTITTVNTDVTQNNDTLIAQAQGVAYQWLDCNDNYSQIQTANTMLFVPESSGDYAVKINDNGCIDTSNCYNVVVSNINNIDDNIIEIYPNPAKQFVNIIIPNSLSVNKITIYNITGVEVFTNKNNNKNYLINVSELKTGTYFIEIISTEKTITKKLIIK